jgi:hypothetical protein
MPSREWPYYVDCSYTTSGSVDSDRVRAHNGQDTEETPKKKRGRDAVTMLLAIPRYLLKAMVSGATMVITGFIVGIVLKSFTDAIRSIGFFPVLFLCGFMSSLVFVYSEKGSMMGAYAAIAALLAHLLMWGIGFYKVGEQTKG